MDIMSLIVAVILIALVCVAGFYILRWMALPEPWGMIVRVLCGLLMLLVLVAFITGKMALPSVHL